MRRKKTHTEFVRDARNIHGDMYSYPDVYIKAIKPITIICQLHGEFKQRPNDHTHGKGCPKCGGVHRLNTTEFIDNSKKIHNNKYDYSLVVYKTNKNKVKIICPTHGQFEQRPNSHLGGQGCPKCAGYNKTFKELVNIGNEKHNNKYKYIDEYNGCYIKYDTVIKIICPTHGEFKQVMYRHINNLNGCPYCCSSKGENKIKALLDNNRIMYNQQQRFNDCKNKYPLPFDFYLPYCDTCIEYDGRQHFEVVEKWNGEEGLKDRQTKDKIKTDYCSGKDIKLIRIRYDENIEEILKKEEII